jgi:hypothetical protein
MNQKLTFVSAFINIYNESTNTESTDNKSTDNKSTDNKSTDNKSTNESNNNRSPKWRLDHFRTIAETGIPLCIYISPEYQEIMVEFIQEFPNVKIMKTVNIQDTFASKVYQTEMLYSEITLPPITLPPITLPNQRSPNKDTHNYILLMNAKTEFMQDAIEQNPWSSTHFAWIDFNIAHIFKAKVRSQEFLKILAKRTLNPNFLTIPGCWAKLQEPCIEYILDNVHWRFCGGFFLGDKQSIIKFNELYREYFPQFIRKYRKLVWEVNFWAWLELNIDNLFIWYKGDHDDSILHFSADFCSVRILDFARANEGANEGAQEIKYDYPKIEGYEPMTAAYCLHQKMGQPVHMINTRYVNYWLTPEGRYIINDPNGKIISKNMYSELDGETMKPLYYKEMQDPEDLPMVNSTRFQGLEDIRLFLDQECGQECSQECSQDQDQTQDLKQIVKFSASTICYSPSGKSRIVIGNYDVDKGTYTDCIVVEAPDKDSWCEKNWVTGNRRFPCTNPPFIKDKTEIITKGGGVRGNLGSLHYGWSPQQIGSINPQTMQLEIHTVREITAPYFSSVRGSSEFTRHTIVDSTDLLVDVLVGVVHFSEEYQPRHYFHILVMLEPETLKLLKYSEIFYFDKIGIEFCIGFTILDFKYHFWISKHDRDPTLVICSMNNLPFL